MMESGLVVVATGRASKEGVKHKQTKKGKDIYEVRIGVNVQSSFTRERSEGDERPDWIFVTVRGMGRAGEALSVVLPGDMITVSGRMDRRWWQPKPKDGQEQPMREEWSMFADNALVPRFESYEARAAAREALKERAAAAPQRTVSSGSKERVPDGEMYDGTNVGGGEDDVPF